MMLIHLGNSSTNICGIYDKMCYQRIDNFLVNSFENSRQCLPSCNNLNYEIQMKQFKLFYNSRYC